MEEKLYFWYVVNLIAFTAILFAYQFVRAGGFKPYTRGFFCDDQSIALPFRESTVPASLYHGLSLSIPLLTVSSDPNGFSTPVWNWMRLKSEFVLQILVSALVSGRRRFRSLRDSPRTHSLIILFPSKRRYRIPGLLRQIISQSFYFGIGYCLTGMFTECGKCVLGRLRPNFLDVCKPNYTLFDCVDDHGVHQYLYGDKWCTGNPNDIQESR